MRFPMGKSIILILILLLVCWIDGLDYQFRNGIATFRLKDDDTTIAGVKRNSRGVVQVKLSCGLNKLTVKNKKTGETSIEQIHNCVQTETRLAGLYLNSTWIPLNEVKDTDEVSIASEIRYLACFEDYIDYCDSHLWWLQVGGNEVAQMEINEKCKSGEIEEDYERMICKRKQNEGKTFRINDDFGSLYDGQVMKGFKAKKFSLGGHRNSMISQKRRKRDVSANTCDYTLETTSTSTTTPSTTTTVTTTVTTTTTTPTTSTVTSTTTDSTSTETTSTQSTSTTEISTTDSTSTSIQTSTESTSTSTQSSSTSASTSTESSTIDSTSTASTTETTSTTTETSSPSSTSSASSSTDSTSSPASSTSTTEGTTVSSSTLQSTTSAITTTDTSSASTSTQSSSSTSPFSSTSTETTLLTSTQSTSPTTPITSTLKTTVSTTTVEPLPANAICSYLDETTTSTTVTTTVTSTTTEPTTTELTSTSTESTSPSTTIQTTTPTTSTTLTTSSPTTTTVSSSSSTSPSTSTPTSTVTSSTSPFTSTVTSTVTATSTATSTPTSTPTSTAFSTASSTETSTLTSSTPTFTSSAATSSATTSTTSFSTSVSTSAGTSSISSSPSSSSPSTSVSTTTSFSPSSTGSTSELTSSADTSTTSDIDSTTTSAQSTSQGSTTPSTTEKTSTYVFSTIGHSSTITTTEDTDETSTTLEATTTQQSTSEMTTSGDGSESTSEGTPTTSSQDGDVTSSDSLSTTTDEMSESSTIDPKDLVTTSTDSDSSGSQTTTDLTGDQGSTVSSSSDLDFTLANGMTWNETIEITANLSITPISTANNITEDQYQFECRNDSNLPFVLIKESTCLIHSGQVLLMTFTKNVAFSPAAKGIVSVGVYEIRITLLTTRNITHILILNVIDSYSTTETSLTTSDDGNLEDASSTSSSVDKDVTTSSDSSEWGTTSTDSSESETSTSDSMTSASSSLSADGSDSSTSSFESSDSLSSDDSQESSTVVPYDFTLNGFNWNSTIYFTDDRLSISPVPNKDVTNKTISYLCRNDSSTAFVPLIDSNCLTPEGKSSASYAVGFDWSPVDDFIPQPGTYEYNITVTNTKTLETATHLFTLNVLPNTSDTTTMDPSITSTDSSVGSGTTLDKSESTTSSSSGMTESVRLGGSTSETDGSVESTTGTSTQTTTDGSGGTTSSSTNALEGSSVSIGNTGTTTETHSEGITSSSSWESSSVSSSLVSTTDSETSTFIQTSTKSGSTRVRGILSTLTPISAAEQAAIDAQKADISNQLAAIIDGSASNNSLNTSSSLLNQISTLSPSDLVEVAQSLLSNTLKIPGVGNMSNVDVLTTLKDNIATTNSELADEMNKVISQLAAVNMTSAQSMNSVLSSLDMALKGSTVYTLGVSSTKSTDGTYSVIFGYVLANEYTLVSPRCTLSIYGSTVYLTGDTRASYLQQTGDTVTANSMLATALGIQGSYAKNGRTVTVDQDKIELRVPLVSGNVMNTMSGTGDVQSGEYSYNEMYVTGWNISYDNTTIGTTNQRNTSMSFWLPVSSAQFSLLIASGTMVKLQSTQSVASTGFVVKTAYGSVTYTITCDAGTAKFIEIGTNSSIFSYDTSSFTVSSSDGSDTTTMKKMIQLPIVVENIDLSVFDSATSPLTFSAYGEYPLRIVFSPQDISFPPVSSMALTVAISTLSTTISYSQSDLQALISNKTLVTVTGTLIFAKASSIDVSGYTFMADSSAIYLTNSVNTIVISSPTYSVVSLSLGGYGIQISGGSYTSGSQSHTTTMMEFSDTQKMRIDGGFIVRNGTNGWVIQNGKVSTEGDVSGTQIDIVPQSLMNQDSQQQIATILSNTQGYLESNGMTMTDAEINDTSNSLLSIASSLTSALQTALNNPLSSDLAANLKYATENYDSLYNVLPSDPNDIVYVEEMTSDEWAAYVTKMMQKSIAKTLANQLASTLNTLENTLAARAIATGNLPYDYSNYADGTGMVIIIDDASNVVGKTYSCDDWDITLPSPSSTLNSPLITDSTLIQIGLVCYGTNPRTYVDNFDMLITSGALEAHVKDENQNMIEIANTSSPIKINGRASEDDAVMTLMQQGDFSSYQILDLHAFRTTNWNNSIQLQIVASQDYEIPANDDTYMFSAFQSLPGPLPNNHVWQYELNSLNTTNTYYVESSSLINNTGLFFVGLGKRNATTTTSNNTDVVQYGEYDDKQWTFARAVPMDYQLTAISKGCYFYLNSSDMFNSEGLAPINGVGMQFVNCTSNHLTMFSVGAFNPTIDADFQYNYSVNNIEKNVKVMITAIFIFIVYGTLVITSIISDRKDASQGRLRFLSDNEPNDGYMYVLAVETGYRMFATTDSTISFNLSGIEGDQIFRSFKSEEDGDWEYPFSWGTTSRFVMTTAFPLGQLEYMRMWIDDAGLDHRESWYVNRVVVKDLQTQEIYYFPFYNWLGTKNGDGETERLSRVDYKRRYMDESMSMHMLGQTMTWFAMFTGGGNRLRDRVRRIDYVISLIFSLTFVSMISIIVLKNDNSIIKSSAKISEFIFTVKDIILGIIYGILITIVASLHVLLCCKCRSFSEEFYFNKRRREDPNFKDPSGSWPFLIAGISRSIMVFPVLLGLIYIAGDGMSLMDDFANSFFMRFLISLFIWVVAFEPLKGIIWAFFLLKTCPSHKIVNRLEEAFLKVKPVETFKRNPYGKIEKELGTEIADITKLRDTDNRKMRDEQLFVTLRDMICFFASLYIMVMLTYYCKDRNAFFYQQEISTILNIPQGTYGDNTFTSIRNADDFWTWARESLATAMLASWYDGNPAYDMRAYLNDKVSRSMGIGTIRQVRTKKSAQCDMVKQFDPYIEGCQDELTSKNEEKTLYMQTGWTALESENGTNAADEYTYKTEEQLKTGTVAGYLTSYGGGGYTVSMSGTVSEMTTLFTKLEDERWIDEYTRAIIIEFSTYNAQINYFAVVQLLVEIPKSGIYLTNAWVEPVRLIKSEGSDGSAVKYYEMLYIFFSILIFVKEVIYYFYGRYKVITTMKKTTNPFRFVYRMIFGHFTPWNFMDLIVGALAVASVVAYFLRQKYTNEAMEEFIANNGNSYINLTVQRNLDLAFNYCLAGAVFFTSCKMIRILKFNRRIGILAATLDRALGAIVSFGVAFLFFCMAFNSSLYAVLGNKMNGYRSSLATLETSLAGMLGKLDVTSIKPISNFAFVVCMIYMIVGSKLVLQLYVTIIMFEFEEIRNDSEKQTNDYEIIDHIKYKTKRRMGLLEPKDFNPVSIADTQKDFRLFHSAVAKVNLLHYRATRLLQNQGQYMNETVINYTLSYDPVAAIDKKGPKRFEKWRLNDVEGM